MWTDNKGQDMCYKVIRIVDKSMSRIVTLIGCQSVKNLIEILKDCEDPGFDMDILQNVYDECACQPKRSKREEFSGRKDFSDEELQFHRETSKIANEQYQKACGALNSIEIWRDWQR